MAEAFDIALYFACMADDEAGDSITNLKIQKLLYYAQGACLAITDGVLFEDRIEAWLHGPVVPTVYHKLKRHGASAVKEDKMCDARDRLNEEEIGILNEVYDVYGQFSAWKLRSMTHEEPPWKDAERGSEIGIADMKTYFLTQINQ